MKEGGWRKVQSIFAINKSEATHGLCLDAVKTSAAVPWPLYPNDSEMYMAIRCAHHALGTMRPVRAPASPYALNLPHILSTSHPKIYTLDRPQSFVGDDGCLHIVAERGSIRAALGRLDLSRARLLTRLSLFWIRRVR